MQERSPFLILDEMSAFEPRVIQAMSSALDDVCRALRVPHDAVAERHIIAARILDLARGGMTDPESLCGRVLYEAHVAAPPSMLLH